MPRADFGVVWVAVERLNRENAVCGGDDWYAAGVVVTCRWLATAVVQTQIGRRHPAYSPVTERSTRAVEQGGVGAALA